MTDEQLIALHGMDREAWGAEIARMYPGLTDEDQRKARQAAIAKPEPAAQPAANLVTQGELDATLHGVASGIRAGIVEALRQVPGALRGEDPGGQICRAFVEIFQPILERLSNVESRLRASDANERRAMYDGPLQ